MITWKLKILSLCEVWYGVPFPLRWFCSLMSSHCHCWATRLNYCYLLAFVNTKNTALFKNVSNQWPINFTFGWWWHWGNENNFCVKTQFKLRSIFWRLFFHFSFFWKEYTEIVPYSEWMENVRIHAPTLNTEWECHMDHDIVNFIPRLHKITCVLVPSHSRRNWNTHKIVIDNCFNFWFWKSEQFDLG